MQRFVFKNKNNITFLSGILIIIGILNHFLLGFNNLTEVLFIVASIIGLLPIAVQAYASLKVKVVSIDVLVTIAIAGAFVIKNYEESAIVSFLFLFGGYLEQRTLNKTRSAIKSLSEIAPDTAFKLTEDGEFIEVDIDDVDISDTLMVKTGGKIPVDGSVISGSGYVNEASITGESDYIEKEKDSEVFAGTILENGTLTIRANKVGEDTTFGKIIELVEEAQDSKSEAERFIDSFSKYYTPITLLIAVLVYVFSKDIELAITVLVLGCPGALVIGVPVSNVAGIGNGAKNGVLLKGSELIKNFSKADTFIFDKTGTLTIGKPQVVEAEFFGDEKYIKDILVSVERESDHPLANAIVSEYAEDRKIYETSSTDVVKGGGIEAEVDAKNILIGNLNLMESKNVEINEEIKRLLEKYESDGNSIILVAIDKKLSAIIGIRDRARAGAKEELQKLRELGAKNLIIFSGDNQGSVETIKNELGLSEAHGNMLPEDKANFVKKMKDEGHIVSFVGDGINDSPSLALSDVAIAMGKGTDVAIEVSDVVLMNSDIRRLPHAYGLAKKTYGNMIQNIVIAVGVVIFLLASLVFSSWMNMSIGMFVHEASILAVILNGMRLINYKLR
ncbi:heavy metal translocating P-type ATPase [Peptoniphilus sp.]|jgi:Cd2+/Zn2+-exporting ATPase|uniref:heavy metal translocating P-type ATPase n=1 Tax=Peptoniphilus sp. TaxID=1971214 RepID=UPI003D8E0EB6